MIEEIRNIPVMAGTIIERREGSEFSSTEDKAPRLIHDFITYRGMTAILKEHRD